jgi:hypothetical protein
MSITLTTDPILSLADAMGLIEETNAVRATVLLNSVSDSFRRFTNRTRITVPAADITEYVGGLGGLWLFLHASPITVVTSVDVMLDGAVDEALAAADYTLFADLGALRRNGSEWPLDVEGDHSVRVIYRGGWAAGSVPGDVIMGAVTQMRYERQRFDGKVGVESLSRNGESVSYETGGLLKATRDLWAPYRITV